ncbi:hypothetical protein [Myroides profundi]|uniref:Uncharacterized protein n=1 Tax=Myroides profundi TaxID=480520 RepID=A0AAJ4W6Y6_MYRPR|nr:hypothetical protein [Myroides profundi]AJH15325.1 hypothetical protein MPR_2154 [Myroides profundi]SER62828.1 hypothetical protein SAMN04488089_12217 [Myroides profundi]
MSEILYIGMYVREVFKKRGDYLKFKDMISKFLDFYFSIKSFVSFLLSGKSKDNNTVLTTDIIGKSTTKINYKKLNKAKKSSESLTDLLDKKQDDSFKEIAKRLK